jgi:hypothetical protein
MNTKIFYADGVTQNRRRILVSAGRARKFALIETKDPRYGRTIRCVIELTNKGGESEWQRRRNLERRNPAGPCPPTEVLEHPYI